MPESYKIFFVIIYPLHPNENKNMYFHNALKQITFQVEVDVTISVQTQINKNILYKRNFFAKHATILFLKNTPLTIQISMKSIKNSMNMSLFIKNSK